MEIQKELLIEEVLAYITPYLSILPPEPKPTYLHSVRVGMYLYQNGYEVDVIIAAFLHDMIEDTSITYEDIQERRGVKVADMVLANTKNDTLARGKKGNELIQRCKQHSIGAAIIKAVDLMDGLYHYVATDNVSGATNRIGKARLLLENNPYEDKVFDKLSQLIMSLS